MATVPRRASCHVSLDGTATLQFPYHPGLIQELKSRIPAAYRRYDPDAGKSWTVFADYTDAAIHLLLEYFPDAELEGDWASWSDPIEATIQAQMPHYSALHLLPTAPGDLIDAAYRVLAKRHHPDMGGDAATMRRLTEAHEALRQRVSA